MAVYASNSNLITQMEKELEQAFEISKLGDIKQLLGSVKDGFGEALQVPLHMPLQMWLQGP